MHIRQTGPNDGQPVIFLHGNGTNGSMWKNHMDYLSSSYHCLAPDFPGYGLSNKSDWISLENTADLVADIINQTYAGHAHIVGLSLGSSVAITLLAKRPELLGRVIIDGAGVLPMPGLPIMKLGFYLLQPFLHTDIVMKTITRSMKIPDQDYAEFRENMRLMIPSSFRRSFIQALSLRQPEGLDQVTNHVLFVAGEREPKEVKESNKMLASIMPNAEYRIAPKMGHGWLAEDPNLHCKMVEAWLEEKELPDQLIKS